MTFFKSVLLSAAMAVGGTAALAGTAQAQFGDLSPVLLVESGPSDKPQYRRMVYVKFLSGERVSVNYAAYNRTEFKQVPNTTPREIISACANGPATTLAELQAFQRAEAQAERRGQRPQVVRFCIKNVQGWEAGNRDAYLDPIFDGLPYAASLNN